MLSESKSSFQMTVNFTFYLEIELEVMVQGLEEKRRGTESMVLEVQCDVSTVSCDFGEPCDLLASVHCVLPSKS